MRHAGPAVDVGVDVGAFVIADERAVCSMDSRVDHAELSVDTESGSGALSLVTVNDVGSFSLEYRSQLGLTGLAGPVALVGGGLGQLRAGVWTSSASPTGRLSIITELVRRALNEARRRGARPVSPFVGETDLSAFRAALPSSQVQARASWCSLPVRGAQDLDQLIERQERKPRQTWHRDQRDAERLGLVHDVVPLDDEQVNAAAPFVGDVSRRNGMDEPVQLTRWRLRSYRKRPGSHRLIRTWAGGEVVGYTVCRTWDRIFDAHTVGIGMDGPDRRSVYHYAGYLAPLAEAVTEGMERLDLGLAHEQPKIARGCVAQPMWMVDYGP